MDYTPEGWTSVSQVYNNAERVTTPLAQSLLTRVNSLQPLTSPHVSVFDNGTGTGILIGLLKSTFPSLPVLATDVSPGMLSLLKEKIEKAGWENIDTRTLDSRHLDGIADDSFTHTFSTFMICLAPDPDLIAKEMYRVMQPGGVLGLAVWADRYFGFFNTPFTKACRMLVKDYEPVACMREEWTKGDQVKAGLIKAGFRDVDVREESEVWRWNNVKELSKYFFDGNNPGNEVMIESFRKQGGSVDQVRPLFEKVVEEDYAKEGGSIERSVLACLVTAWK